MLQIAQQGLLPDRRDAVFRLRSAGFEGLRAYDIARFFELARMGAQIAVAHVEQGLEFVEGEPFIHGERTHDAETHPLVKQAIESRIFVSMRRTRHRRRVRRCLARGRRSRLAALDGARLSHEAGVRSKSRRRSAGCRIPTQASPYA